MVARNFFLVIVAAVALATSAEGLRSCNSLVCPEANGLFAHPTDCHLYVKCSNGQAFVETCPANLHFNEATGSCDYRENAKCDISTRIATQGCSLATAKARSIFVADHSVQCDCDCCLKPHEECDKYYECIDHVAYEKECGSDLVFNPATEQCDLPSNYKCPSKQICFCECRYPVDGECSAYYDCRSGEADKKYCSSGLVFNPDTLMCDNPESVNCGGVEVTTKPPTCDAHALDKNSDCKFWAANRDCVCKWTDGDCSWQHFVARSCPYSCGCNATVSVTTPTTPVGFPCVDCSSGQQYWQHPTNCKKFIQCAPYGPQEMPCPKGTRWDQNLLTCNHKRSTPCVTGNAPLPDGSCPPVVVKPTTTQKPVTVRPTEPSTDLSCIDCSTGQQYWQHPTDCHKFVQCAPYGPQEMPCAQGTRWDQNLLTCNHEWAIPCVTGNAHLPDGSCPPVVVKPTTTQKPVTVRPTEPSTDLSCIDCSTSQQYWQHPTDCHKFVQCAPYGPQEMPCAQGTRWDQNMLTCNHIWATPCVTGNSRNPDGTCPSHSTSAPTGCEGDHGDCKYWAANGDCTCKPNNGDCSWQKEVARLCPNTCAGRCESKPVTPQPEPCQFACPSYSGLFPHPKDCTKWVHCDHFIPHVKDCPANLHFNPTLKVCDWPNRAGCTSGSHSTCEIPTPPPTPAPTGPPPTPDPICTCECCHIPHPLDCTSYYYCDVNKNKTFHTCSEGLVFNPDLDTCVLADSYPQCVVEPDPVCECDCHYPSEVCSEYFSCNNGVPEKHECQGGLLWNPDKKSCDYAHLVNCNARRS